MLVTKKHWLKNNQGEEYTVGSVLQFGVMVWSFAVMLITKSRHYKLDTLLTCRSTKAER